MRLKGDTNVSACKLKTGGEVQYNWRVSDDQNAEGTSGHSASVRLRAVDARRYRSVCLGYKVVRKWCVNTRIKQDSDSILQPEYTEWSWTAHLLRRYSNTAHVYTRFTHANVSCFKRVYIIQTQIGASTVRAVCLEPYFSSFKLF